MSENRQRRRVTYTQLLHLWEFLNKHRDVAVGYNKSTQARDESKRMWERVTLHLNSTGDGAIKTWREWSKYWVDYKGKIKRKNRQINEANRRTGGGPPDDLELTELDKKFLSLLGEDYGLGLPGVQVDPLVPQAEQSAATNTDSITSQSTVGEQPVYLDISFSDNDNQLGEVSQQGSQNISTSEQVIPIVSSPVETVNEPASSAQQINISISASQQRQSTSQRNSQNAQQPSQSASQQASHTETERVEPASTGGQRRRQRRRQRRMTATDAREQLVEASKSRAQAELANSQSIQQALDILREMVVMIRKIEAKLPGEAPTNE